ncbi:MAG: ral secretion pathway protein [Burkholderiales bacterium]|jgi:general secretion pathway protein M
MKTRGNMNGLKQSVATFWGERNQRERNMISVAMIVVLVGLFYMLLIDPAMSGRASLQKNLPVLRQQAAEVQAMAKEASALAGKSAGGAAAPAAITRESLEASLTRKGLKAQSVTVTGEIAKVQLASASFAGTVDWLDEMQRTAYLSVVDANIDAQPQPDTVNATITLRQQRSGQTQ